MRRTPFIIPLLLIISACSSKIAVHREPPPVEARVIRKADWEVDFRDVYFTDAKNGWIIGYRQICYFKAPMLWSFRLNCRSGNFRAVKIVDLKGRKLQEK